MDFAPAHISRESAAPPCPLRPSMQTMASPVQSIQPSTRNTLTSIMVIFLIFQVTTMIAASRWNKILHQRERWYQSYHLYKKAASNWCKGAMFSFGTWERQQNFTIGLVATNTSQALLQCSLDLIFDFFCKIKSRFALSVICKGLRKKNRNNNSRTHKKKTTRGSCCLTQRWDIRKLYVFLKPIDRLMLTLENLQLGVVQLHIGIT